MSIDAWWVLHAVMLIGIVVAAIAEVEIHT